MSRPGRWAERRGENDGVCTAALVYEVPSSIWTCRRLSADLQQYRSNLKPCHKWSAGRLVRLRHLILLSA